MGHRRKRASPRPKYQKRLHVWDSMKATAVFFCSKTGALRLIRVPRPTRRPHRVTQAKKCGREEEHVQCGVTQPRGCSHLVPPFLGVAAPRAGRPGDPSKGGWLTLFFTTPINQFAFKSAVVSPSSSTPHKAVFSTGSSRLRLNGAQNGPLLRGLVNTRFFGQNRENFRFPFF